MPTTTATKTKITATHRRVAIEADANGVLPSRIELVKAGTWPDDSNKGYIEITRGDLLEMKANFEAGVSMPEGLNKLAVDFMHQDYDKAAIWIGSLEVEGDTLFGDTLEYTTAGRAAIEGGEFKCISPSFYPRSRGQWHDPEDWSITAENVIVGAALTNIPFFKKLKPITASHSQEDEETTLFVDADAKGANMPTLEDVRVKAAADLTDEEKNLLVENAEVLTADEKVKFGLEADTNKKEDAPVIADAKVTADQEKANQIMADINSGKMVLVEASAHKALESRVEASENQLAEIRKEKVEASVDAAVEAGKIVADQKATWVTKIMADAEMQTILDTLPENKIVAEVTGKDGGNTNSAVKQLQDKANEIQASNKELTAGDAMAQARRENVELRDAADAEIKESN